MIDFKPRSLFKYRVWDVTEEVMILPPKPWFSSYGPILFNMVGLCYIDGVLQRYINMQYLGILDITEEEICEGDILGYGEKYPSVVQWNENNTWFELVEYGYDYGSISHIVDSATPYKIIGNIYENPELIMDKYPEDYEMEV